MGTFCSYPGEPPADFPEFFTTEDMEAMNIEPDYEGMARAARQKEYYEVDESL